MKWKRNCSHVVFDSCCFQGEEFNFKPAPLRSCSIAPKNTNIFQFYCSWTNSLRLRIMLNDPILLLDIKVRRFCQDFTFKLKRKVNCRGFVKVIRRNKNFHYFSSSKTVPVWSLPVENTCDPLAPSRLHNLALWRDSVPFWYESFHWDGPRL